MFLDICTLLASFLTERLNDATTSTMDDEDDKNNETERNGSGGVSAAEERRGDGGNVFCFAYFYFFTVIKSKNDGRTRKIRQVRDAVANVLMSMLLEIENLTYLLYSPFPTPSSLCLED